MKSVLPWLAAPLVMGVFVLLIWLERKRPLRKRVEPDLSHGSRNLIVGTIAALVTVVCETPLIQPLAQMVERQHWGLLGTIPLPTWAAAGIALVLMDYTFYIWHVLLHRWPVLWRFHAVHHVDLDLDTSTALRFHFGELILSIPWRAAQVVLIGLSPGTFVLWQIWFALCVMFHHSNVRLPAQWERWINVILVTPRMHAVHHSNIREETDSNWSSGLTIWDRLHKTLRLDVPQEDIEIGVPAFRDPRSVRLRQALAMPFVEQPDYWQFPEGSIPRRSGRMPPPRSE